MTEITDVIHQWDNLKWARDMYNHTFSATVYRKLNCILVYIISESPIWIWAANFNVSSMHRMQHELMVTTNALYINYFPSPKIPQKVGHISPNPTNEGNGVCYRAVKTSGVSLRYSSLWSVICLTNSLIKGKFSLDKVRNGNINAPPFVYQNIILSSLWFWLNISVSRIKENWCNWVYFHEYILFLIFLSFSSYSSPGLKKNVNFPAIWAKFPPTRQDFPPFMYFFVSNRKKSLPIKIFPARSFCQFAIFQAFSSLIHLFSTKLISWLALLNVELFNKQKSWNWHRNGQHVKNIFLL